MLFAVDLKQMHSWSVMRMREQETNLPMEPNIKCTAEARAKMEPRNARQEHPRHDALPVGNQGTIERIVP